MIYWRFCLGCRLKIHKEHLDRKNENKITPCKVYYDSNGAKELLLLASSVEHQQKWINCLRKKIELGGYAAVINQQNQRHQSNVSIASSVSSGNSKEQLMKNHRSFASTSDIYADGSGSPVGLYSHHRSTQNVGKSPTSLTHSASATSASVSPKSATLPQLNAGGGGGGGSAFTYTSQLSTISADANLAPHQSDQSSSGSSINSVSNSSLNSVPANQPSSPP